MPIFKWKGKNIGAIKAMGGWLYSFKMEVNDNVEKGTIEFRGKEGELLGKIDGVGKDTRQIDGIAEIPYAFIDIDPKAMFAMAKVMAEGLQNHVRGGWRNVPLEKHLNNGLSHIYAYLAGDHQDEHLSHALCRVMFAVALEIEEKERNEKVDNG